MINENRGKLVHDIRPGRLVILLFPHFIRNEQWISRLLAEAWSNITNLPVPCCCHLYLSRRTVCVCVCNLYLSMSTFYIKLNNELQNLFPHLRKLSKLVQDFFCVSVFVANFNEWPTESFLSFSPISKRHEAPPYFVTFWTHNVVPR